MSSVIEIPYVCGTPDSNVGSMQKWNKKHILWGLTFGRLGPLDKTDLIGAFETAYKRISDVCGLIFEYTEAESQMDFVAHAGPIDGPSGTLAWHELPPGDDRQLKGKVDSRENWVIASNPPRGSIDLVRVWCHEAIHGGGVSHIPTSLGRALMNPMYSSIEKPQELDILELQRRYGPKKPSTGGGGGLIPDKPKGRYVSKLIQHYDEWGRVVDVSLEYGGE